MDKPVVNQWDCDSCNKVFYNELGEQPKYCPYCQSNKLSDSKMWELERLTFKKD